MNNRDDAMGLAHIALAVEGCSWTNPDYFAMMIANTVSSEPMMIFPDPQ